MIEAFTDHEKEFLLQIVTTKIAPRLEELAKGGIGHAFYEWYNLIEEQKQRERDLVERGLVQDIMRSSVRGHRSSAEKEVLRSYLQKLAIFPKDLSATTMDLLCNEIDHFPITGESVVFLQGDFGNVYYVVAEGSVDLYLERSKDQEMVIGRDFGKWRGVPYTGSKSDFDILGKKIVSLSKGQGFGEIAILSTAAKLRSCSVVSSTEDTFLFILHDTTYDAVLRQHHFRSKQLSEATILLQNLPIFNMYSYSKLSNIAYAMRSCMYQNTQTLVKAGQRVESVLIVNKGQIKAILERPKLEASAGDGVLNAQETLHNRLPKLAKAVLGRGSVIGEFELLNKIGEFRMTYVSCSSDTEVFEMPAKVYSESCAGKEVRDTDIVKSRRELTNERERGMIERLERTEVKINKFAMSYARNVDDKAQLLKLLPLLIDGVSLDGGVGGEGAGGKGTAKASTLRYRDMTSQDFIDKQEKMATAVDMQGRPVKRGSAFDNGGGFNESLMSSSIASQAPSIATLQLSPDGIRFLHGTPKTAVPNDRLPLSRGGIKLANGPSTFGGGANTSTAGSRSPSPAQERLLELVSSFPGVKTELADPGDGRRWYRLQSPVSPMRPFAPTSPRAATPNAYRAGKPSPRASGKLVASVYGTKVDLRPVSEGNSRSQSGGFVSSVQSRPSELVTSSTIPAPES